jgi:hypothetical protein
MDTVQDMFWSINHNQTPEPFVSPLLLPEQVDMSPAKIGNYEPRDMFAFWPRHTLLERRQACAERGLPATRDWFQEPVGIFDTAGFLGSARSALERAAILVAAWCRDLEKEPDRQPGARRERWQRVPYFDWLDRARHAACDELSRTSAQIPTWHHATTALPFTYGLDLPAPGSEQEFFRVMAADVGMCLASYALVHLKVKAPTCV